MDCSRKILTDLVSKKLGNVVPKYKVKNCIDILFDHIKQELLENNNVSIDNFGTLSPYVHPSHPGYDNINNRPFHTAPQRSVKFRAHAELERILRERRSLFTGQSGGK